MKRIRLAFLFLVFLAPHLSAQSEWNLNDKFSEALQRLHAEVMPPLDGAYKVYRPALNDTQNCQWALRSRKERLEIRYLAAPFSTRKPNLKYPSIAAHRLAMHICSNEENSIITARDLTEHEQETLYNADWGRVYIFPPKLNFSPYAYCKMVALYKEGKGMAYIFNLFDNPSPNIDSRLYSFRFMEEDF